MWRIKFVHPWRSFPVGYEGDFEIGLADMYVERLGVAVKVGPPEHGAEEPKKGPKKPPAKR